MRELFILTSLITLSSCHSDVVAEPKVTQRQAAPASQELAIRVIGPDHMARAGVTLVGTNLKQGAEIFALTTDSFGTVRIPKEEGAVVALTAADATSFAFLETVDTGQDQVEIRLSDECLPVVGRLVGADGVAKRSMIRFARYSDRTGDTWALPLNDQYEFRACLPRAAYEVRPPPQWTSRYAVALLPLDNPLIIPVRPPEALRTPAPQFETLRPHSQATFVAALKPAQRVLGFGETNHGTREFTDERTDIALELARKRGFRLVMLETGYGETLALDDYLMEGRGDLESIVRALGYWMWDTKTFLADLRRIRTYNTGVPYSLRIHVLGFDMQLSSGAAAYLLHAEAVVQSSTEAKNGLMLLSQKGAKWTTLSTDVQRALETELRRIASATFSSNDLRSPVSRAILSAKSLLAWIQFSQTESIWQQLAIRDRAMAEIARDCIENSTNRRASLWGHLGHLARTQLVGEVTMGGHLASSMSDEYSVYALLANEGSARAWDSKNEVGVTPHVLEPAADYTLEHALFASSHGSETSYWHFAEATGGDHKWLTDTHMIRQFGAVFPEAAHEYVPWDLEGMDGAVLFKTIHPSDPTPTGERRATKN